MNNDANKRHSECELLAAYSNLNQNSLTNYFLINRKAYDSTSSILGAR